MEGAVTYTRLDNSELTLPFVNVFELDGERIDDFPSNAAELERVKPVLQTFPGWDGKVADARKWDEIPVGAQKFVEFIEEFTGVPVQGFSVGPLRDETFMKEDPWTQS